MLWGLFELTKHRRYGLALGAVATVGGLLAAAGVLLAFDWLVVTYPGKGDWQTYEQRTPSWLWQVGVALACIGSAVMAGAALAAERQRERRRHTPPPPVIPERLYMGLMIVVVHVLAIGLASVTVRAAETSDLRMRAWLSVGLVVMGSLMVWKLSED